MRNDEFGPLTARLVELFASPMNVADDDDYVMSHVVFEAWRTGARSLRVDLLTGATDGSPLLTPLVQSAVERFCRRLPSILSRLGNAPVAAVKSAELRVRVRPGVGQRNGRFMASPFSCTVILTDGEGNGYSSTYGDWWRPEREPPPHVMVSPGNFKLEIPLP